MLASGEKELVEPIPLLRGLRLEGAGEAGSAHEELLSAIGTINPGIFEGLGRRGSFPLLWEEKAVLDLVDSNPRYLRLAVDSPFGELSLFEEPDNLLLGGFRKAH